MLKDLRVIELASVLAGPSVGQFFAEVGAEVFKIENPGTGGDVTRSWKASQEKTDDISAYFSCTNWGKKSVSINAQNPEGRNLIYELVKTADIVVVSYKPGDAEKLKMDYGSLKKVNPQIIYGKITGFGALNGRSGYDAIIQAESGFMSMNGEKDGASLKMPVALMDVIAGHHLKEGLLLALMERSETGEGKEVEVSLMDAALASLANQAANWLVAGIIPQKKGSEHPNIAPYGDVFKTKNNGEIILAVGNDVQFQKLCTLLSVPQVANDHRFATNAQRVKNRKELVQLLAVEISNWHRFDILTELEQKKVPAGGIYNVKEALSKQENNHMVLQSSKKSLRGVYSFVGQKKNMKLPDPPHVGEHTVEVLKGIGVSTEQIETLQNEKVIFAR